MNDSVYARVGQSEFFVILVFYITHMY